MKHKFLIVCSLFCGQFLLAQQTRTIALKEAIDLSLQYSKLLKLNEAKILEATTNIKEAEERKKPDASASLSALYLPLKPTIDLKAGSNNNGGSPPSVHFAAYTTISASLPIYTAGKIQYGIESAKLLEQAAKLNAENDKSVVILNTINACINLFKAHQAIALVKENLAQQQQRVKDLTNLEKNGLLARNDLLKAELQASNIELTLVDAESNYKLAYINMNIMLGLPEQTILVPDRNGLALPISIKTVEEYEQIALQNRKDIDAINFRKKAAEINIKNIKADKYPMVVLTGGYIAAEVPKLLSLYNAVNIGVGVKYNIASLWKNNTRVEQAAIKVKELQSSQDILNDNIRLQINQAYQTYLVTVKKIEVYEKSIIQATENYRIVKNKYDNTLATTTELLEADVALLQAKLSVTNAKADSFLAYNKILYAAGLLTN